MKTKTFLTAIYARVSTKDKGQDPEMQLYHLRKYAKSRGMKVYKEYVDKGVSGTKEKRPALDELMESAKQRKFDAVLVFKFDRFARSSKHLIFALEEFKHLGIDFISYTENLDTSSPMGQAMFTVMAAMGQLERDLISERVKAGLERAKSEGRKGGRPKAVIDIQKARRLREKGLSYREVAKKMKANYGTVYQALSQTTT